MLSDDLVDVGMVLMVEDVTAVSVKLKETPLEEDVAVALTYSNAVSDVSISTSYNIS